VNYQEMLAALQGYWADQGCVVMQPYHTELGAGTANPATFLRCLGPHPFATRALSLTAACYFALSFIPWLSVLLHCVTS